MDEDPALPYFRQAAAAAGMSLDAWAKANGIILPCRQADIERHEIVAEVEGKAHCPTCRRRSRVRAQND